MLNFKSFIIEDWVDPKSGINEPVWFPRGIDKKRPLSIFTQAAGYGRNWDVQPGNYNPRSDALVHTTNYFPENGVMRTLGSSQEGMPAPRSGRETLHFTRNGIVSSHMWGNFEGRPFTIIAPQGPVVNRIIANADQDTWVLGNLEVPNGSKILVHEPALTGEQKANLAKLAGVENYDQLTQRLQKGLDVDFNGRKINLKTTKGNIAKSVEAELRSLGISPLKIGTNYAVGFSEPEKMPKISLPDQFKPTDWWYRNKPDDLFDVMKYLRRDSINPRPPFLSSAHQGTSFFSGERWSEGDVNPHKWVLTGNTDKIQEVIDTIDRPLHPEEQAALQRQKNWRDRMKEWMESQRKEYDKDPKAFVEKRKAAEEIDMQEYRESEAKRKAEEGFKSRGERLQAEKEASAEAVRKYQSGEFVPPQKPETQKVEPQQTRVQEPESPKFSEDIAGLSPEGVVPKSKLARGLGKIGTVAAEAVPMAFGDYAARKAGHSLGMGEQDAEMAGLAGSFAVPVAMSAAGMGAGPQAAVTIPGYVGGRLLSKGIEASGLGDLETSAMTKLSNAWVSGKEGFKSDTDKVWNPQAGKYMTAKETSDFLRKQSEIERATDLTKGFASPEEAEAHFKRMKDDPEYKKMIDWRMAKAGQREAERQQGGSAVMAKAMGTDAAETLIPDWVTNIGEYDPLGRATSAALDAAGYIPGAKKLGKKFVDVLGWLEKD